MQTLEIKIAPPDIHPKGFKIVRTIEYHANGTVAYIKTIALIPSNVRDEKHFSIVNENGDKYIYFGETAKYYDNGQLRYNLEYDQNGKATDKYNVQYRKDGSHVVY